MIFVSKSLNWGKWAFKLSLSIGTTVEKAIQAVAFALTPFVQFKFIFPLFPIVSNSGFQLFLFVVEAFLEPEGTPPPVSVFPETRDRTPLSRNKPEVSPARPQCDGGVQIFYFSFFFYPKIAP